MFQEATDAAHKPALVFATIYSNFPELLYKNYFENGLLLLSYLSVRRPDNLPIYPDSRDLPDVCGRCRYVYGSALGGRLRSGCHRCGATPASVGYLLTDKYALQQLCLFTGYGIAWWELLIATAIFAEDLNGYRDTKANAAACGRWIHSSKFEAALPFK